MRSPLYEQEVANPGTVEGSRSGMDNLIRALSAAANSNRDEPSVARNSIIRLLAAH